MNVIVINCNFILYSRGQIIISTNVSDSCYKKKLDWIFIYPLNVIFVPKLSSVACLGAQLESVADGRTDRHQVNVVLTPALLGWCQGLS